MTLRLHISDHNDDLHNTTAKKSIANGVASLDGSGEVPLSELKTNVASGIAGLNTSTYVKRDLIEYSFLTIEDFRANSATGTCTGPYRINNDSYTSAAIFDTIGEYAQVMFDLPRFISHFYFTGSVGGGQNGDGTFKLQIYHSVYGWIDNTLNISTVDGSSGILYLTHPIVTTGIKIIATLLDTQSTPDKNYITEFFLLG